MPSGTSRVPAAFPAGCVAFTPAGANPTYRRPAGGGLSTRTSYRTSPVTSWDAAGRAIVTVVDAAGGGGSGSGTGSGSGGGGVTVSNGPGSASKHWRPQTFTAVSPWMTALRYTPTFGYGTLAVYAVRSVQSPAASPLRYRTMRPLV